MGCEGVVERASDARGSSSNVVVDMRLEQGTSSSITYDLRLVPCDKKTPI